MGLRSVLRNWLLGDERRYDDPSASDRAARFWGWDLFGTLNSEAGVLVNEQSAANISAVFAAVSIIGGALGTIPLTPFRRDGRSRKPARDDPAWKLLRHRPNPFMDAQTFREIQQARVLLWGNAFAEIERDGAGRPINLWPIHPGLVKWDYEKAFYGVSVRGQWVRFDSENMLHVKGLGDGIMGESVVSHARNSLGLALAAEKFGAAFFGNGAMPGLVATYPGTLSDKAKDNFRRSWNSIHRGPSNAQKLGILEEGMKIEKVGVPPDDAQFLETRQFQRAEIANWFQIPLHMLNGMERMTLPSAEQMFQQFIQMTLLRWMTKWEQETAYKLLDQRGLECAFNPAALLRADSKTRGEFYKVGTESGWLTRNDVREAEGFDPLPGLDRPMRPLNFVELDDKTGEPIIPAAPAAEAEQQGTNDAAKGQPPAEPARDLRPMVEATWRRVIRAEVNALRAGELDWTKHERFVRQALEPLMPAVGLAPAEAAVLTAAHILTLRSALNVAGVNGGRAALLDAWERTKVAEKTAALLGREN